ncbi:efflux RND transporter periplasmic adaptor subunit [Marinomonas lutimaris]|uniref:efflux RND transporter periplasmic adaptor subunit n=1 Tax=Marinomonas lutimaris TaxID=2846746 RepID=UPI0020170A58|nr:HlyD family efflux transporter periplasmic adaptor subunit [Marinomonas lutimaris]
MVSVVDVAAVSGHESVKEESLGELRNELRLFEGPTDRDGAPTWTLEDPLSGQFYRLGWPEMEMLARWSLASSAAIVEDIRRHLTLDIDLQDVKTFYAFLSRHHLLKNHSNDAVQQLADAKKQRQLSPLRWLLKHYLFFRVPLCRPDAFLEKTLPIARFFVSPIFWFLSLLALLAGGFLVSRQWGTFTHTFLHFFSFEGAVMMALALSLTKTLHELGHAYTCKYFGGRVATMGVALLVLWPVLYTDTTSSWRLKNRRQRMLIGAAGVMVEMVVAAWAILLWSFLPDGVWRSLAFMLGTSTWLLSLLVNLSPFMRFDGYFLLSDLLGIANLQQRAFAFTRWQLREWLFGFKDAAPEVFSSAMQRMLLLYSFVTWVYRLFLFIGIALMVYHFAFKLLGIFLFIVEMAVFVVSPIMREVKEWYLRRSRLSWNKHTLLSAGLLILIVGLLFIPWRGEVIAYGVLRAKQESRIYVPEGARLQTVFVSAGENVKQGQVLYLFSSPELEKEQDDLEIRVATLKKQIAVNQFDRHASANLQMIREELFASSKRLATLSQQIESLSIRAPFDGVMAEVSDQFQEGSWLSSGAWLGTLIGAQGNWLEAFVDEVDVGRIQQGNDAHFIPENISYSVLPARLMSIEDTGLSYLSSAPELASVYGGPIASLKGKGSNGVPRSENVLYRIFMSLEDKSIEQAGFVIRGKVVMEATSQSIASRLWTRVVSVFVRESSF